MTDDWVLLHSFPLEYQASILKAVLEDEGIDSFVINRKDSAYRILGAVEIHVKREDFLTAKHILEKSGI